MRQKKDKTRRDYEAAISAQYALTTQWTVIEDMHRNLLEPRRNLQDRQFKLPNYLPVGGVIPLPMDSLTFILATDNPDFLQEIHIAEKHYLRCAELLEELNKFRLDMQDKYQPKTFNPDTGIGFLEVPLHRQYILKDLTNRLYVSVDKARVELNRVIDKMNDFIKSNFKGRRSLKIIPVHEEIGKSPPA